jgi:hypothetical protein
MSQALSLGSPLISLGHRTRFLANRCCSSGFPLAEITRRYYQIYTGDWQSTESVLLKDVRRFRNPLGEDQDIRRRKSHIERSLYYTYTNADCFICRSIDLGCRFSSIYPDHGDSGTIFITEWSPIGATISHFASYSPSSTKLIKFCTESPCRSTAGREGTLCRVGARQCT